MKKLYKAVNKCCSSVRVDAFQVPTYTIRYDTIVEFNVDSKAEYTA